MMRNRETLKKIGAGLAVIALAFLGASVRQVWANQKDIEANRKALEAITALPQRLSLVEGKLELLVEYLVPQKVREKHEAGASEKDGASGG